MSPVPYFFFNGNCAEAMKFYQAAFGGELNAMKFKDAPQRPPGSDDKIMHALLRKDDFMLMASDACMPGHEMKLGTNITVCINADSAKQVDELFAKLSAGGQVQCAPVKQFWGAYWSSFKDKYGNDWMLNFHENAHV